MKKVFSVLFALMMMAAALMVPVMSTAESTDSINVVQIDWSDTARDSMIAKGYDARWLDVTFGDGKTLKMLVPEGYEMGTVTDEEKATGVVVVCENKNNGGVIKVKDSQYDAIENLIDFSQKMQGEFGDVTTQYASINGNYAAINSSPSADSTNICFALGEHRFIEVLFSPVNGNNDLIPFIIAAIQF